VIRRRGVIGHYQQINQVIGRPAWTADNDRKEIP
jgi:hypothetical protein